jgi:hypothetical protein
MSTRRPVPRTTYPFSERPVGDPRLAPSDEHDVLAGRSIGPKAVRASEAHPYRDTDETLVASDALATRALSLHHPWIDCARTQSHGRRSESQ